MEITFVEKKPRFQDLEPMTVIRFEDGTIALKRYGDGGTVVLFPEPEDAGSGHYLRLAHLDQFEIVGKLVGINVEPLK